VGCNAHVPYNRYGGMKNYLGHDKRWVENLILFPDRHAPF
jgi:hypothetical protein